MFDNIRSWWLKHQTKRKETRLQKARLLLFSEIDALKMRNASLQMSYDAHLGIIEKEQAWGISGERCVQAVLKRGIDFYDPSKLPYADQVAYVERARAVLANETLQNEIKHLEADWVSFCAQEAPDFASVRDMRMCINALEMLLKRLSEIHDPRDPERDVDEFSPV